MQGQGERVYYENIEGLSFWGIQPDHWLERVPGLSAMVRLKDEAEWVIPALDSIVGWCDEVAIFLQGEQTDGTDTLVGEWAQQHPSRARVFYYPFESLPNGPGHEKQPRGSVHERAYFYNWCHARTRFSHAMKWDGDMVAQDWLGAAVREAMGQHEVLRFRGTDIAGAELRHMSVTPRTANEPRVWRVSDKSWWYSGHKCEYFTYGHGDGISLADNAYIHLKWAKDAASARKDWPANWQHTEHFQRINRRAKLGELYKGPWPNVLIAERKRRAT